MRLSLWYSALLLPVLAAPVPAQQHPAEDIIHNIIFHGETPYSQSSLEAASGLHSGDPISQSSLQAATERLIDTAAFSDVQAVLDGPAQATDLIFTLKPTDSSHLLRASFENFIWWQPNLLTTELQKRVPLFNGFIPEGGSQQNAIAHALQKILTAKGIRATVSSELIAPYPYQPLRLADFRIQPPLILIHSLTLAGVSPTFIPRADRLRQSLINSPYNEGLTSSSIQSRILDVYRDAGYQEASITNLTRAAAASTASNLEVNVTATVHEGEPYHLSSLEWSGSPLMSAQAFNAAAKLHPGDLASQQSLRDSLANLDAAYRNHGYMDVIVDATPKLDTANHQVVFTVSAVPGPQYRLRNLTVLNLTPAQQKEFDSTWKLRKGDIYDASYITSYLKNRPSLHTLAHNSASFKLVEDPENSALDLTINFTMQR